MGFLTIIAMISDKIICAGNGIICSFNENTRLTEITIEADGELVSQIADFFDYDFVVGLYSHITFAFSNHNLESVTYGRTTEYIDNDVCIPIYDNMCENICSGLMKLLKT